MRETSLKDPIVFADNPSLAGRQAAFITIDVKVKPVIECWRNSLFSHEWLDAGGAIRPLQALSPAEQSKRQAVEDRIAQSIPLSRPVLGIGILDTVEIGSGRAEFLTAAAHGVSVISVHVPASQQEDFKNFRAGLE